MLVAPSETQQIRVFVGNHPIPESAIHGPSEALAMAKISMGLNAQRDGFSFSSLTYDTSSHVLGVNLEAYIMGLSEAGLSTRSSEPMTIEMNRWGNSGGARRSNTS